MAFSSIPRRQRLGLVIIIVIVALSMTPSFQRATAFPRAVRMAVDSPVELDFPWPGLLQIRAREGQLLLNGEELARGQWSQAPGEGLSLKALSAGPARLELRLLGLLPFRQMEILAVPRIQVVPGGQSVGILARAAGLLVIEHAPVTLESGDTVWPAREAGIRPGDLLLAADGHGLKEPELLSRLVQRAGARDDDLEIEILRGTRRIVKRLKPAPDRGSGRYLMGLWVRDGAAGVGTLTFWDEESRVYAALGHEIVDPTNGRRLEIESGVIVEASVWGLERAESGRPGEKIGVFDETSPVLGDIQVNADCGILGHLRSSPSGEQRAPVDIALADEVVPGPAEVLTVLRGSRVESFAVEIERVSIQVSPGVKSLVIRVVDPHLMETAGGIVQGMSGSPIIQEGRLVGAVTHVFLGDPSRGYGVFAEWMAVEAGSLRKVQAYPNRGLAATSR